MRRRRRWKEHKGRITRVFALLFALMGGFFFLC
jgi:hypothetical protein